MPPRYRWDLSHHFARSLKIGRLMTFLRLPVLPGDGHSIQVEGKLEIAELRRPLPFDVRVDFYAFYCPYRHTYDAFEGFDGSNARAFTKRWQDYVYKGYDSTGENRRVLSIHEMEDNDFLDFLPVSNSAYHKGMPNEACLFPHDIKLGKIPRHVIADYMRIWDYYFRHPNLPRWMELRGSGKDTPTDSAEFAALYPGDATGYIHSSDVDAFTGTGGIEDMREFGARVMNLKSLSSNWRKTGEQIDDDDWNVPTDSADKLDLRKLREYQMQYKSETRREYYLPDYAAVMKHYGGAYEGEEPKPVFLGVSRTWMSGGAIVGHGDGNLGLRAGHAQGVYGISIPRRFIPEHGTIWVLGVIRFPNVYREEIHRLDIEAEFKDWHTLINEPGFSDVRPRELWSSDMFFASGTSTDLGEYAVQEHYRTHPSNIHRRFLLHQFGFPYRDKPAFSFAGMMFHPDYGFGTSFPIFRSEPLGHATMIGNARITSQRMVAPPAHSLMLVT